MRLLHAVAFALLCPPLLLLLAGAQTAQPAKEFKQDFESSPLDGVPKGWVVTRTGEGKGSNWRVIEDRTAPNGTRVLAQTAESPGMMFNLCVADESSFGDLEISVAFHSVAGKVDQGGGVVWRYVDASNYYIARFNPLENNLRVYRVVEGKRTQLATREEPKAPVGQWHTLTVRMKGDRIECLLNGDNRLEAIDATFARAGKVGLWTKADARTNFDNFRVVELPR